MNTVKIALIQMKCSSNIEENVLSATAKIREAANNGANIIVLPELFENVYFCQERRYEYYSYAKNIDESTTILTMKKLAKELDVVLPVSFYEKDGNVLYNSVAIIDADGSVLGVYRKTHIPDDHYYQEKFYFTPGNTGFKVWNTKYGKLGVGICWDQWFCESARCMALLGADILIYPSAIGSEPILNVDSSKHWQRTMQGHSACNVIPLACNNRIGLEVVEPCQENGYQSSSLNFYGSSFITDNTGAIIQEASKDKEEILYETFDFETLQIDRLNWGLFRDRREEMYTEIIGGKK